jgi:hypothetical protein
VTPAPGGLARPRNTTTVFFSVYATPTSSSASLAPSVRPSGKT